MVVIRHHHEATQNDFTNAERTEIEVADISHYLAMTRAQAVRIPSNKQTNQDPLGTRWLVGC
jgi:hypothetical protein